MIVFCKEYFTTDFSQFFRLVTHLQLKAVRDFIENF